MRRIIKSALCLACLSLATSQASELISFQLPWDDSSASFIDLSGYNHKPAGKFGYISVNEDGHFAVDGQRVRLYGVNITADSCFPSHEEAEKIAGRLAKFGFNIVRFHHMDNNWGSGSIIDYAQGNSRHLHASNLERLDYFIAKLKAHGIYANLNLINSREFGPSDGLDPSITSLDWKQRHILGFVDQTFRNLEKEYASQLLAHINPYTELTYAEDPAIAVVEVNNENGIFHQYFEGSFNSWPTVYKDQLQDAWNAWLQSRYQSTHQLLQAWSGEIIPLGNQLIDNSDFASGTASWNIEQHEGAAVNASTGSFDGRQGIELKVSTPGGEGWHIQINQGGKRLMQDQLYTLSFWAKADASSTFSASIGQSYDPWGVIHSFPQIAASSSWQKQSFVFRAAVSDDNLRLSFADFGTRQGSLFLSDITLNEGGSLAANLPEGQSLEAANIASNLRSESSTPNRAADWTRFLSKLAVDYWSDMRDHIKQTLEYGGLVNGSTIMNSPPNIQAVFDFVDTHAYWQHPVFPGEPWDSSNWYVNPVSMVNTLDSTVAGLARQHVDGYPQTVSEYRHAYPNPFASEGPLLIAAYAALQDWDGIYFFDYARGQRWDQGYFDSYFNMNSHPSAMANALVAATLFRRFDVAPAKTQLLMNFSPEREVQAVTQRGRAWNVGDGRQLDIPAETFAVQRVALSIGEDATGLQSEPPAAPSGPIYASDTEELRWDTSSPGKGFVTINTDRSKAFIGFIDGRDVTLGTTRIEFGATQEDWATVSLAMVEGSFNTRYKPARLLIVATGLTENTGMQWTDDSKRSVGNNWGQGPTRVEAIPATIHLPYGSQLLQAWALDATGQRADEIAISSTETGSTVEIGGASKSLWYEVQIAADPESDPYTVWKKQQFEEAQWDDPDTSGPTADPDHDGIQNLMEFALGLDPQEPNTRLPIQQTVEMRDGRPIFVYTLDVNQNYPTENLSIASSLNLSAWDLMALNSPDLKISLGDQVHERQSLRIEYIPPTYPAFSRLEAK